MTDSAAPLFVRGLGGPTVLLIAAGVLGQVFTLARTLFVAARIGTAPELDALLVALVVPLVVSGLLVSSLRTAIVPAYLDIAQMQDESQARRFVGVIVTWIALLGLVAAVLLILVPGPAVDLSGPGLTASPRAAAIRFLPIVAPILVLSAVSTLLGALCQIAGRFLPIAVGLAVAPLASLVATVALWDRLGLDALAFGMTLGAGATLAVTLVYVARAGLLPPVAFRTDRRQLGRFLRHALPLTAGSAVLQFNLLADRAVATILPSGAVSALTYGQQIVLQPLGSVISAWTMVLYPSLVRVARDRETGSLGAGAAQAIRATIVVFTPIMVTAAALAPLVVDVVYRRGAFDVRSAAMTAGVVAAFAPLLLEMMIQPILTGAHNARRRGTLLGLVAVANALLNVVLNVIFGLTLGVAGVALSTSITVALLLLYLAHRLSTAEEGFAVRPLLQVGGRALLASLVQGLPLAVVAWVWLPQLPLTAAAPLLVFLLAVGLGGYLVTARLIRFEEPGIVLATIARGLKLAVRKTS